MDIATGTRVTFLTSHLGVPVEVTGTVTRADGKRINVTTDAGRHYRVLKTSVLTVG
jgi:hypothetical protein